MNQSENILRAVRFERPERIPMMFHINGACWHHYPPEALRELMASHPLLFSDFDPRAIPDETGYGPRQKAGKPYEDKWGCIWETTDDGITGVVTRHPLADWDAFDGYARPAPETQDWASLAGEAEQARARGEMVRGGLPHGHTFLTLCNIRGYENVILDMADNEPRFSKLLAMIEEYNAAVVRRHLDLGAIWMGYPEDLGMQVGPMLSPAQFRTYIKPVYQRLMAPARQAGVIVHMHSDGDIRALVDDLIDGGVEVMNLQDLVNGVDWIAENLSGRMCIDLDIDRQRITRFGAPAEIDALIREEVEKLGSREGGLMMCFGLYPGTPLENVRALMDAMERYATFYN